METTNNTKEIMLKIEKLLPDLIHLKEEKEESIYLWFDLKMLVFITQYSENADNIDLIVKSVINYDNDGITKHWEPMGMIAQRNPKTSDSTLIYIMSEFNKFIQEMDNLEEIERDRHLFFIKRIFNDIVRELQSRQ